MSSPYDVPPPGSVPLDRAYVPGDFATSERYDLPEGSHGMQPDEEPEFPPLDDGVEFTQDDESFATVSGVDALPPGTIVGVPAEDLDTENGEFIVIPQDGD